MTSYCKIAAIQLNSVASKEVNFAKCARLIQEAAANHAKMVFLPEAFDFICESSETSRNLAETISGPLITSYRKLASDTNTWLSLGGMHRLGSHSDVSAGETAAQKLYNTHIILDANGRIVATYDKVHLFDVLNYGSTCLTESESSLITAGSTITPPVDSPAGRLGLMICYDLRFPELSARLRLLGANVLLYPSAFMHSTGRQHWETLLRARAIETQSYVIAAAQTGEHYAARRSHGHSLVVAPSGEILVDAGAVSDCVSYAHVSVTDEVAPLRRQMPVEQHRRPDVYTALADASVSAATKSPNQSAKQPSFLFPFVDERFCFGHIIIEAPMVFYCTPLTYCCVNKRCVVPGHVLVIPRRPQARRLPDLSSDELLDLFTCVQRVQCLLEGHHHCTSSTVCIQDGEDAGQTVKHLHVHVMPRKHGDFAFNDDVYLRLASHDKGPDVQWRDDTEMIEECQMLRLLVESEYGHSV